MSEKTFEQLRDAAASGLGCMQKKYFDQGADWARSKLEAETERLKEELHSRTLELVSAEGELRHAYWQGDEKRKLEAAEQEVKSVRKHYEKMFNDFLIRLAEVEKERDELLRTADNYFFAYKRKLQIAIEALEFISSFFPHDVGMAGPHVRKALAKIKGD